LTSSCGDAEDMFSPNLACDSTIAALAGGSGAFML
jgi:hypothetical protein